MHCSFLLLCSLLLPQVKLTELLIKAEKEEKLATPLNIYRKMLGKNVYLLGPVHTSSDIFENASFLSVLG